MSSEDLGKKYFKVHSRLGRSIDHKNVQLKYDRTQILLEKPVNRRAYSGKPKEKRVNLSIGQLNEMLDEFSKPATQAKPKVSQCFNVQGRDAYYKSTGNKLVTPSPAQYSASYNFIHQRIPSAALNSRPTFGFGNNESYDIEMRVTDKTKGDVKVSIEFAKQIPRPFPYGNLNEKRFSFLDKRPETLSNVKRVSTPNLGKGTSHNLKVRECENFNIYDCRFDIVLKNGFVPIIDFGKTQPRKPLLVEGMQNLDYENVKYSLIEKQTRKMKIWKEPRPRSSLPNHMIVTDI